MNSSVLTRILVTFGRTHTEKWSRYKFACMTSQISDVPIQYYMNQLQPNLKLLFFLILYVGTFFRALKYWPYTASNSFHHFLPNNNTNSRFPRRLKNRGEAVYWFVLQTSLKMAKIPIFAHFSFIVFRYYLNDLHLSGHWIRLSQIEKLPRNQ